MLSFSHSQARSKKSVCKPTWKDVPDEPDRLYLNITKPAEPNILLTFHEPVAINLPGGLRKQVTRLALFVDEPDQFMVRYKTSNTIHN